MNADPLPLPKGDRWLSTPEAAAMLGYASARHFLVIRKRFGDLLPAHPVPGNRCKLRYKLSDVRQCLKASKQRKKK